MQRNIHFECRNLFKPSVFILQIVHQHSFDKAPKTALRKRQLLHTRVLYHVPLMIATKFCFTSQYQQNFFGLHNPQSAYLCAFCIP